MPDLHKQIKELERDIEKVKSQFSLGKASLNFSKKRVLELEKELFALVSRLPEDERDVYLLRKEFGKDAF
jgi:hypothetical protein